MISPGAVLGGRYRLEERIASGGMGDVWRGVDDVLGTEGLAAGEGRRREYQDSRDGEFRSHASSYNEDS